MSKNVDAVKEMYACFGRGDVAGILARLDPEVEWEHDWGAEPLPLYQPRHARDAVVGFFQALADFEFRRFEPVAFLEGDDMVAVPIRIELRHKTSGREFRDLEMHLWTFGPNGLVTRFRHMVDTRQFAWMLESPEAPSPTPVPPRVRTHISASQMRTAASLRAAR